MKCYLQAKGLSLSMKRTESSEETESTTTASRRGSDDSDSGVNLSEKEMTNQHQPGRRPARPAQPRSVMFSFRSDEAEDFGLRGRRGRV